MQPQATDSTSTGYHETIEPPKAPCPYTRLPFRLRIAAEGRLQKQLQRFTQLKVATIQPLCQPPNWLILNELLHGLTLALCAFDPRVCPSATRLDSSGGRPDEGFLAKFRIRAMRWLKIKGLWTASHRRHPACTGQTPEPRPASSSRANSNNLFTVFQFRAVAGTFRARSIAAGWTLVSPIPLGK